MRKLFLVTINALALLATSHSAEATPVLPQLTAQQDQALKVAATSRDREAYKEALQLAKAQVNFLQAYSPFSTKNDVTLEDFLKSTMPTIYSGIVASDEKEDLLMFLRKHLTRMFQEAEMAWQRIDSLLHNNLEYAHVYIQQFLVSQRLSHRNLEKAYLRIIIEHLKPVFSYLENKGNSRKLKPRTRINIEKEALQCTQMVVDLKALKNLYNSTLAASPWPAYELFNLDVDLKGKLEFVQTFERRCLDFLGLLQQFQNTYSDKLNDYLDMAFFNKANRELATVLAKDDMYSQKRADMKKTASITLEKRREKARAEKRALESIAAIEGGLSHKEVFEATVEDIYKDGLHVYLSKKLELLFIKNTYDPFIRDAIQLMTYLNKRVEEAQKAFDQRVENIMGSLGSIASQVSSATEKQAAPATPDIKIFSDQAGGTLHQVGALKTTTVHVAPDKGAEEQSSSPAKDKATSADGGGGGRPISPARQEAKEDSEEKESEAAPLKPHWLASRLGAYKMSFPLKAPPTFINNFKPKYIDETGDIVLTINPANIRFSDLETCLGRIADIPKKDGSSHFWVYFLHSHGRVKVVRPHGKGKNNSISRVTLKILREGMTDAGYALLKL